MIIGNIYYMKEDDVDQITKTNLGLWATSFVCVGGLCLSTFFSQPKQSPVIPHGNQANIVNE